MLVRPPTTRLSRGEKDWLLLLRGEELMARLYVSRTEPASCYTFGMLDPKLVKKDFPLLNEQIHGREVVYLDSAATSQKPRAVLEAMEAFYHHKNANVHRGVHALAERATEAFEQARSKMASFIGAQPQETVWTRNATEALNIVARGYEQRLSPGDEVLLTVMEHHSNLVPWHMVAQRTGAVIKHIPLLPDFTLDLGALDDLLTARTKVVAFTMMSNVLGAITPVKHISARARHVGAHVVVDAAQAAPHMSIDVRDLDVDYLALSGHKMMGPTGAGILYGKFERLQELPPFMGGGEMISIVKLSESTYKDAPHKFEAGTPAIAEAVGLGAAADYLTGLGMDEVHDYEQHLASIAIERLRAVRGLRVLGPEANRGGAVSFVVEGVHAHDIATILDQQGVAVRAGHHCTMPLHDLLGVPASARASFYVYNSEDDVDRLVQALESARKIFEPRG